MSELVAVKVPDIGDFKDVEVIEILVKVGDRIEPEQSLITVESDKASMEIPADQAGVVKKIDVKIGDKVSQGSVVLHIEPGSAQAKGESAAEKPDAPAAAPAVVEPAPSASAAVAAPAQEPAAPYVPPEDRVGYRQKALVGTLPAPTVNLDLPADIAKLPHASPSVRKFARELGVDLSLVKGTGPKGRITQEDVQSYVKGILQGGAAAPAAAVGSGAGLSVLPWPQVDFTTFGPIETKPLSRIKKISGANLHRNWVMIPHVTNNDEADITELEELPEAQ